MPRMQCSIRDLFWLTLVAAVAVGWWIDNRELARLQDVLNKPQITASGDPLRPYQLITTSDNLKTMSEDWQRFWLLDQPSHMSPIRPTRAMASQTAETPQP